MQDRLLAGLARIQAPDGTAVGAGLLIGSRHVITCAHVVNVACGLDPEISADRDLCALPPNSPIEVAFPTAAGEPTVLASVEPAGWHWFGAARTGDVAVLMLHQPAPRECEPPPLLPAPLTGEHSYLARGFPEATDAQRNGVPATGKILEATGPHLEWRLLSLEKAPYVIEQGFSGGPIWDADSEAVVGIVVAVEYAAEEGSNPRREAGYMIAMETLVAAWPELEQALGWRVHFDPDYERHWEPHSRGVKDSRQEGRWFTGRHAVLDRLAAWIENGEEGAALVTGRRGSGKSAVLAQVVMADERGWPPVVSLALVADREAVRGEVERGMTVQGAAEAIATWMALKATGPSQVMEELRRQAHESGRRPLIVVDQLDEADDRLGLAQFFGRLAREGAARVLVGLRADAGESGVAVADSFGSPALKLDLDSEFRDDPGARDYALKLLLQVPGDGAEREQAERLAGQIAERARESFLLVQILANQFAAKGELGELASSDFPPEAIDAIGESIRNLAAMEGGDQLEREQRLRDLLTPLAYAGPNGLPVHADAWPAMATALSPRSYANGDVADLIAGPAAQAIRFSVSAQDGSEWANLSHPDLSEGLRRDRGTEADHWKIVAALFDLCPEDDSEPAEQYVAEELARHVAQSSPEAWGALAERPHVLDRLDPVALAIAARPLLLRGVALPPEILGALDSQHLGPVGVSADRTGLRQLGMARVCHAASFREERTARAISSWRVVSAVLRQHPSHLTLRAGSAVNGVTTLVGSDGTSFLAAGCEDRGIRLWSVATGKPHGNPPSGARAIRAIDSCHWGSSGWLVFGDEGGLVKYWDPVTDNRGEFHANHGGQLRAISAFATERGIFVVTAGDDHEALLWREGLLLARLVGDSPMRAVASRVSEDGVEIAAGNDEHCVLLWELRAPLLEGTEEVALLQPDRRLRGAADWLRSVVIYGDESAPCVAAGGDDCKPRAWQPPRTTPIMDPPHGHEGRILATVSYEESGTHRLATGGADRTIRLWSPSSPEAEGLKLEGHEGPVQALASHRIDDSVSLVSGGVDQTVRIWPLGNTPSWSEAKDNFLVKPLSTVGRCEIAGAPAAVAGYADGTVRVWNPSTGEPMTGWISAHAGAVRTIAPVCVSGEQAFATGGDDGVVRFFNPVEGKEVSPSLVGHEAPLRAIADGLSIADETVLATGSEDGTIRIWRLTGSRRPITVWPQPGPVRGLALTQTPRGERGLAVIGYGRELHRAFVDGMSERREHVVEAHADWGMAIQAYADDFGRPRIVSTGDDGAVVAFDPLSEQPPRTIGRHDGPARALALVDQDGRRLVASGGEDGVVAVWDPDGSGTPLRRAELGPGILGLVALDERLLVGTAEGHVVIELKPV